LVIGHWALALCLGLSGCLPATPGNVPPHRPDDKTAASDQEVWSALADFVERGRVDDTDQLLRIVRELGTAGYLQDTSHLARAVPAAAAKNQKLDNESVRVDIANRLRTKSK
jgi:type IV secretory pathway TrbF-like protein